MKTQLSLLFLGALVAACVPQVSATNPYDSNTPVDQQQKATLAGTVSGASGTLEGAVLTLSGPTSPANNPITTAVDGAFNFGELTPGTYSLSVEHASHFAAFRDVILGPGEQRTLALELVPLVGGASTGHLTGIAQKSGELTLASELQDHSGITVEVTGTGVRTVTNREGRFDLFLNDGTYDVTFDAPEYERSTRTDVVVLAEETVEIPNSPIVLAPNPGSIVGSVYLEGKDPSAALHGSILVSVLGTSSTTQTAPDGSYRLDDLAAGTYTLVASKSDASITYATSSQVVLVRGGQQTDAQDMTLAIARGRVTGTVNLIGETDKSGVAVTIVGTTYSGISNSDGAFAIEGVPVGTYDVEARKQGYSTAGEAGITVESGLTTAIASTLVLSKQSGDFQINDGAAYTNNPVVTLTLSVTNAVEMMISEDSTFTDPLLGDTSYQPYASEPTFTLSGGGLAAGDGEKTVYVQTRDADLNVQGPLSNSIVLDTQDPTDVTVTINGGAAYTNADTGIVSLAITASDATSGVRLYQASNTGTFSGAGWQPYSTSVTHVLATPATQEQKTVYLKVRDWAGNETDVAVTDTIKLDYTKPVIGTFTLNCPDAYTALTCNSAVVGLTIAGTDGPVGVGEVAYMKLANEDGFAGDAYESYASSRSWLLTPGDGDKTINLVLMDAAGNESDPAAINLELDTTPPSALSVTINGILDDSTVSTSYTATSAVSLTLSASDGTGSGLAKVWLANDPSFVAAQFGNYATSVPTYTLSPTSGEALATVYVRVADGAGNITASSGNIYLDTVDPLPGFALASSYTTGGTIDATLTASGATQMCFSGNITGGSTDSCVANGWETYNTSKTLNLTTGDEVKTINAYFRDAARNKAAAAVTRQVTRDGTAPSLTSASVTVTGLAATGSSTTITRVANVSVSFTGATDPASGITQMMVSESNGFSGAAWQSVATTFPWVLSGGDGSKSVYIKLRDAAGNATTGYLTGTIELDQTAPSGVTLALDDPDDADDDYTRTTSINATISASGAATVCLLGSMTNGSSDNCLTNGWLSYGTSKSVTLSAAQGVKTVSLFARDLAGNVASVASDTIFLDAADPDTTTILSVTPYTTSVFLDLDTASDAGGSGVTGYEVDYRVVGDASWTTVSLDTDQGIITGLTAPRVYQFVARSVDRAGRESASSSQVDRLVGLSTSIVEGFENVGAIGDRVISARGMVLFPRMPKASDLVLLSCDARRGRCTDTGLVESKLSLNASLGCHVAASQSSEVDVAVTQQGRDVWLFGTCFKMGGGKYQTFALRSPKDPNELLELDQGTSALTDLDMWRLVDLGETTVTPNFNASASAAANGQTLAFAQFESTSTPTLKMRMCRSSDDCTNAAAWSTLTFGGLGASDKPSAYTDMDAGKSRLWFAYGSQAPAVRVFSCDTTTSACTADGNWSRVTLPNTGLTEVYSVRVLEARDTLYVASLQRGGSGPGVFLWTCSTATGCDAAGEFTGPVSLSATAIQGPKAVVGAQERTPRLSLDWSSGYLSYASTDYLVGEVTFARCKLTTGCATLGDWTPVTVLETSTVEGQADLTSVAGNPMLFVGRDSARAYILEPYTPSPVGRALLPDLETGGMRAYLTPRDADSSDGYIASYNTTSFTNAFATEVIALNPNTESFAVTSTETPIYGSLRSFRGSDLSFADPYYFARAASPREIASSSPKFPRYEKTGQCHVSLYVTGTTVRAEACLLGGTCAAGADWKTANIMTVSSATGLSSALDGNTLWLAVSGTVATGNDNIRYTSVTVNSDCTFGTPATLRDVFASSQTTMPYAPVLAVSSSHLFIAYGDPVSGSRFGSCARSSACDQTLDWSVLSAFAGDSTYHGGDVALAGGRVYWLGRRNDSNNPDTFLRYCTTSTDCNAAGEWTTISLLHRGPTSGAGSLNIADGYLLWTQEDELAWCDLATGCDDAKEWQSGGLTPDYLSSFDARTGVLGRHNDDFVFVGYGLGGIYVSRCPARCWKSDSWFGGFVGRSAQFGAELWVPYTYDHWGKSAGIDVATGEVTLTYRFMKGGDAPTAPSALRFNTGMKFELSLAP